MIPHSISEAVMAILFLPRFTVRRSHLTNSNREFISSNMNNFKSRSGGFSSLESSVKHIHDSIGVGVRHRVEVGFRSGAM